MSMKRLSLLVLTCACASLLAVSNEALAKYEEPVFSVLEKDGAFEIRDYPEVISAEVTVPGSAKTAANDAFRIIGGYIFGKNVSKKKIAMTVPVTEKVSSEKIAMTVPVTTDEQEKSMTMRFFMPASYTLETLPEPLDKRIKFVTLAKARYAVVRFSGVGSEQNCQQHEKLLQDFMKKKDLRSGERPVRAFYNAPWTLPFLRRNEIWQKITP